jgi:hypothetical protein
MDSDCLAFPSAVCDTSRKVCIPASPGLDAAAGAQVSTNDAGPDGATACQAQNGCFACPPSSDYEFLSACSDAICVPFDNRGRLANLNEDGSLKPLP